MRAFFSLFVFIHNKLLKELHERGNTWVHNVVSDWPFQTWRAQLTAKISKSYFAFYINIYQNFQSSSGKLRIT